MVQSVITFVELLLCLPSGRAQSDELGIDHDDEIQYLLLERDRLHFLDGAGRWLLLQREEIGDDVFDILCR